MVLHLQSAMPSFEAAGTWVGGGPVHAEDLRGAVTLVHFWSVACGPCHAQLPSVARWAKELGPRGLRVVGVHVPVEPTATNWVEAAIEHVAQAAGLTHPITIDRTGAVTNSYELTATPAYFVFDGQGLLRYRHAGIDAEAPVESKLREFLDETARVDTAPPNA